MRNPNAPTCKGCYALGTACGDCARCDKDPARPVKANEVQVGGEHYRTFNADYQHWDLVADTGMGYFEGQITKYVARWSRKSGRQDLEKAMHYAHKMNELVRAGRYPMRQVPASDKAMSLLATFAHDHKLTRDETIVFELCAMRVGEGDLERLSMRLGMLLDGAR
jgi:hypothetical protein